LSSREPQAKTPPGVDPGAFSAALFEAYKGGCDCNVCRILRDAVQLQIGPYLKSKVAKASG